jgi:hypothetical protein
MTYEPTAEELINQLVIAAGEAGDYAVAYADLALMVADLKRSLRFLTSATVTDPETRELECPPLLQADLIIRDHQAMITNLDLLEIQVLGRAGAWRGLASKYDDAREKL